MQGSDYIQYVRQTILSNTKERFDDSPVPQFLSAEQSQSLLEIIYRTIKASKSSHVQKLNAIDALKNSLARSKNTNLINDFLNCQLWEVLRNQFREFKYNPNSSKLADFSQEYYRAVGSLLESCQRELGYDRLGNETPFSKFWKAVNSTQPPHPGVTRLVEKTTFMNPEDPSSVQNFAEEFEYFSKDSSTAELADSIKAYCPLIDQLGNNKKIGSIEILTLKAQLFNFLEEENLFHLSDKEAFDLLEKVTQMEAMKIEEARDSERFHQKINQISNDPIKQWTRVWSLAQESDQNIVQSLSVTPLNPRSDIIGSNILQDQSSHHSNRQPRLASPITSNLINHIPPRAEQFPNQMTSSPQQLNLKSQPFTNNDQYRNINSRNSEVMNNHMASSAHIFPNGNPFHTLEIKDSPGSKINSSQANPSNQNQPILLSSHQMLQSLPDFSNSKVPNNGDNHPAGFDKKNLLTKSTASLLFKNKIDPSTTNFASDEIKSKVGIGHPVDFNDQNQPNSNVYSEPLTNHNDFHHIKDERIDQPITDFAKWPIGNSQNPFSNSDIYKTESAHEVRNNQKFPNRINTVQFPYQISNNEMYQDTNIYSQDNNNWQNQQKIQQNFGFSEISPPKNLPVQREAELSKINKFHNNRPSVHTFQEPPSSATQNYSYNENTLYSSKNGELPPDQSIYAKLPSSSQEVSGSKTFGYEFWKAKRGLKRQRYFSTNFVPNPERVSSFKKLTPLEILAMRQFSLQDSIVVFSDDCLRVTIQVDRSLSQNRTMNLFCKYEKLCNSTNNIKLSINSYSSDFNRSQISFPIKDLPLNNDFPILDLRYDSDKRFVREFIRLIIPSVKYLFPILNDLSVERPLIEQSCIYAFHREFYRDPKDVENSIRGIKYSPQEGSLRGLFDCPMIDETILVEIPFNERMFLIRVSFALERSREQVKEVMTELLLFFAHPNCFS